MTANGTRVSPWIGAPGAEGEKKDKPDFPPFAEFAKDFQKVAGPADGADSLYTLFKKDKDQSLIAELPKGWAGRAALCWPVPWPVTCFAGQS